MELLIIEIEFILYSQQQTIPVNYSFTKFLKENFLKFQIWNCNLLQNFVAPLKHFLQEKHTLILTKTKPLNVFYAISWI